jgi:glycosyltransferase involved in cell wall biosynthesis
MPPRVSILIPAFNAEGSISDTIRSALAQSWSRKEIVVVDDGSKDKTLAIARQFASQSVLVVSQENQGAAAARNKALSVCDGDYVQWLDADDLLSADKIAKQMHALNGHSRRTLASAAWGYFRCRPSKAKFVPTQLWEDLEPLEWMVRKWEHNRHMQPATWLVSRELTEVAGPWDLRLTSDDDGEYFSRIIMNSDRTLFVPDARVYYRISNASRLSNIGTSDRKMESQFLAIELQIGYLRSLGDSDRVRRACIEYLQTWLIHFYPNRPDLVDRAEQLANSLGGQIRRPTLSWKYDWIRRLYGWPAAKRAQIRYNERKSSILTFWDKTLFRLLDRGIDPSRI